MDRFLSDTAVWRAGVLGQESILPPPSPNKVAKVLQAISTTGRPPHAPPFEAAKLPLSLPSAAAAIAPAGSIHELRPKDSFDRCSMLISARPFPVRHKNHLTDIQILCWLVPGPPHPCQDMLRRRSHRVSCTTHPQGILGSMRRW